MYDTTISMDDLDGSFERIIPTAVPIVRAGQSASRLLALAHLRALLFRSVGRSIEPGRADQIAGTTHEGLPLEHGLAAVPAMLKQSVSRGRSWDEVNQYGRYLMVRFADNETTQAADRATESAARNTSQITGWQGVVSAKACDPCRGNLGQHALDDPIYRHGGCNCQKQYITI